MRPTNLDNSRAYYACKRWGKRGAVVEWFERRGYGAESRRKVVSSRLGNFLCQPSSKQVTFSNQGKIRQRKERDGLCPSFAVLPPQLLSYGKPLPEPLGGGCLEFFLLLLVSLVPSVSIWEEARCRL